MPKKKRARCHDTKHVQMRRNYCFACGPDNPHGMHLKFSYDEEHDAVVGRVRLPRRYWGPPKHAHGGIIATVLDEAMGKVNRKHQVVALTSEMKVEYLKPVPLSRRLLVEARERSVRGRRHVNVARSATSGARCWLAGRRSLSPSTLIACSPSICLPRTGKACFCRRPSCPPPARNASPSGKIEVRNKTQVS